MNEEVQKYIASLNERYATGQSTEHTYRPALEKFIEDIGIKVVAFNEPKHSEFGAPDFALTRGNLILGYIETKTIGENLDKVEKSNQMERYLGYKNCLRSFSIRIYGNKKLLISVHNKNRAKGRGVKLIMVPPLFRIKKRRK